MKEWSSISLDEDFLQGKVFNVHVWPTAWPQSRHKLSKKGQVQPYMKSQVWKLTCRWGGGVKKDAEPYITATGTQKELSLALSSRDVSKIFFVSKIISDPPLCLSSTSLPPL